MAAVPYTSVGYGLYTTVPKSWQSSIDSFGNFGIIRDSFTVPTAKLLVAGPDYVDVFLVPRGLVLLRGRIVCTAGGTGAKLDVGDGTTVNKYGAALDVAAAGVVEFMNTIALGYGTKLTADLILRLTANGADFAAAGVINVEVTVARGT